MLTCDGEYLDTLDTLLASSRTISFLHVPETFMSAVDTLETSGGRPLGTPLGLLSRFVGSLQT